MPNSPTRRPGPRNATELWADAEFRRGLSLTDYARLQGAAGLEATAHEAERRATMATREPERLALTEQAARDREHAARIVGALRVE